MSELDKRGEKREFVTLFQLLSRTEVVEHVSVHGLGWCGGQP
jgi:hypothetical protein